MAFIFSIVLLVAAIIPCIALLHLFKRSSRILAFYLLGFGLIALNAEIGGFAGLLDKQWFFLLLQTIEVIICWAVWWKKGKPALFATAPSKSLKLRGSEAWDIVKKIPLVSIFSLLVTAGYGVLAWLIIRVPPNNSDSMHTHLARIMYWLQQGSFKQLTCYSIYAKIYPFDAQLNVLWTILFTHSDKFVGFVQFFATIAATVAIYGLGRLLHAPKKHALLASLIFLTFPLIVYQATSTQFDLVVTALFTGSIYFFFDYYQNKNKISLFLSALAMGLALGTKETVFMMGPAVLVIAFILLIKDKHNFAWLWRWAAVTLAAFLVLGSYPFFNNLHYYGNPLGPSDHVQQDSTGYASLGEKLKYNPPRFLYQFISFDSLPTEIANPANNFKNDLFTTLNRNLNLDLESLNATKDPTQGFSLSATPNYNEDEAWFGVSSFVLLIPAFIAGICIGIKKKDLLPISLALFAISFFLCEIWLRPGWDPYQGRYFIMGIAIIVPLTVLLFTPKLTSRLYQAVIVLIALLTFFMAVFSNESKPILAKHRFEIAYKAMADTYIPQNAIQRFYQQNSLKYLYIMHLNMPFDKYLKDYTDNELRTLSSPHIHTNIVEAVNNSVPADATMGIMLVNGDFDYVFFGPQLRRRLINIVPEDELYSQEWLESQKISYVLISQENRFPDIPSYLKAITKVDGWGLYSFSSTISN